MKTLVKFLVAGSSLFIFFLFAVQSVLVYLGGWRSDPSVLYFYPLMALLGTVWGFEQWWSYEIGPYNPFHDHN